MNWEAILQQIDLLVFQQTGQHLGDLQRAILLGVMDGQKYAEIAEKYKCTTGHAKDEGYKLWKILSDALGEEINKSNFRATIERLGVANSQYQIVGNPVQIGYLNVCTSPEANNDIGKELSNQEEQTEDKRSSNLGTESDPASTNSKIIKKLINLGLTHEQIAETLELSLTELQIIIKNLNN